MAEFYNLSDYFILRMYEFIRHEAHVDVSSGPRLIDLAARQHAKQVLEEIDRRGLFCRPIDWLEHTADAATTPPAP